MSDFQIVTKQGNKREMPNLWAYNGGIWVFPFFGDETYTDPYDSSVWYWVGVTNDVDEILAILYKGVALIATTSLADCRSQDGSFYWDDTNGLLYVHWYDFGDDWYFGRSDTILSEIIAGYANGYSNTTHNVYDGVYYDPIITDVSGLVKSVDLTKLGLVTFEDSSLNLLDRSNTRYQTTGIDSVGIPLWVYLVEKTDTELTDNKRIFTGTFNGYSHNREDISFQLVETRFFQNVPVCPNTISSTTYANVGDLEGELIPTAWGQIRRGITLLTNIDSLTTGASGTAIFLVSDPALSSVLAITNVYNEAGETQSITGTNLTACTVNVTKPVGIAPGDLKSWTWEGQGYSITGTYNNGLSIIRAAYEFLADIEFTSSTFDQINWNQETTDNPQAVGISIKSEKGFVEEIIEPATTSLQGIVEILGNGRISWASRDTSVIPIVDIPVIKATDQLSLPDIEVDPSETVSELQINYSPNFKEDESLTKIYTDDRLTVISNYTIDRREPLSPVETILVTESDVDDLAKEIMETSAAPVRRIKVDSLDLLTDTRFFQIVGIDTGTFGNENIEYGELLTIEPNYNEFTQNITIRVIPNYVPLEYAQGTVFGDQEINDISPIFTDQETNNVSNVLGVTTYN
jgi:hypothetical protein